MTESTTHPGARPRPPSRSRQASGAKADPEEFVRVAKDAVVENFNSTRDVAKIPAIGPEDLFIISYARILQNWEVFVTSPVARHVIWQVTFNKYKNEVYILVYQKINSVKTSLSDKVPS